MGTYEPPVDQFLSRSETPVLGRNWPDYLGLGIGPEHISDLIRMATDRAGYVLALGSVREEALAAARAGAHLCTLLTT